MSIPKNDAPQTQSRIMKSAWIMSLGTLASRILGFLRDIIFARYFGTAISADAFVVAFRIPNLFRDLLGEGAANSSFVPVMTEYKEKKAAELPAFLNAMLAWAFIILCAVTLLGMFFAPQIVHAIAPGFAQSPEKMGLAVDLTRIMFPYLVFIGLTAFFAAIQFTFGSFTMPAFGPCLLNIVMIASTLFSVWWLKEPVYGLAFGVLAGGALQLFFQWRPLRGHGVRFFGVTRDEGRGTRDENESSRPAASSFVLRPSSLVLNHPGASQVGRLIIPRIIGSAVYQLNIFVDTICASLASIVGPGGISAIYYANRLVLLPVGLFAVSIVTASLPAFSKHAVAGDLAGLRKSVKYSLENLTFFMLPSSLVLVLLAEPIVRVMFERGVFDEHSTAQTAISVLFLSVGLVFFGISKVLTAAFHSLQDTRTPVKVAFLSLAINAILNVALMFPMKLGGIALSSAIASAITSIVLFHLLIKRVGAFEESLQPFLRKALLAALIQAGAMIGIWMLLGRAPELVKIIIAAGAGLLIFGGSGLALGMEQAQKIAARLGKRRRSAESGESR